VHNHTFTIYHKQQKQYKDKRFQSLTKECRKTFLDVVAPPSLVPYVYDVLLHPQQVKRERVEEEMRAEVEAWKVQQDEEEKAEKVRNGEQGWEQESS